MNDLQIIEETYKKYINNLNYWLPEGLVNLNLNLLHNLDLLHFQPTALLKSSWTRGFRVIRSSEKMTLINDEFVVWIRSTRENAVPVTYTLIALSQEHGPPKLEIGFLASGVYNIPRLILRVLDRLLLEIQETENVLSKFK